MHRGFAAEALAQRADPADSHANPFGGKHEMAGRKATQNPMMADHSQRHGRDAAALCAVRLAPELARPNPRFKIGECCGISLKPHARRGRQNGFDPNFLPRCAREVRVCAFP